MHFSLATLLLASSALCAPSVKRTSSTTSANEDLIAKLLLAPTGRDRIELLPNDNDFTYDFNAPPTELGIAKGLAGHTVNANRKTMPSLIGTGSSMTVGFLSPCGMNTPHTHPRGTELNIVVEGSLVTTMILENGVRAVQNNVTKYQMNVFPQGALHMEFNPDCTDAVFVAGFNNEDAGTQQTMDAFMKLNSDVITAAIGGEIMIDGRDIDQVKGLVPANVALGVEECLQKCGLTKR